ncbi:MAG: Gfo/Idh/MocA family oxidoreductase [Opitutaceae bacterium]
MTPTPSAGRRVRVGILGTGGMGGAHAQRFRDHPDVQITALGDVSPEHMERFIATHLPAYAPRPAIFTDASAMMHSGLIDAVAIITPHTLHFDHAMLAADAGLHVLMEKPMVTAAAQAHALATRFASTGKVFVIGYNTPCTPAFAWLREAIRTRRFGRLELISGYLSQNWKHLTTGSWRQIPTLSGGGQAYDSGAHLLNSLCWSVESDIAEVFAFLDQLGTPVDINAAINLRFANGVMACLAIGGNCVRDGADMHFMFEQGRVDIDGWMGQWIRAYDAKGELTDLELPGRAQTPNDNFIDAILGRAEPRTSLQNGIVHSELMDAIYASARTGQPARPARS